MLLVSHLWLSIYNNLFSAYWRLIYHFIIHTTHTNKKFLWLNIEFHILYWLGAGPRNYVVIFSVTILVIWGLCYWFLCFLCNNKNSNFTIINLYILNKNYIVCSEKNNLESWQEHLLCTVINVLKWLCHICILHFLEWINTYLRYCIFEARFLGGHK